MQFGFDFGHIEQISKPVQNWNDPKLSFGECSAYLNNASIKADLFNGVIGKTYAALIRQCISDLKTQNERMNYSENSNFILWVNNHRLNVSQFTNFINNFEASAMPCPSAETKIRKTRNFDQYSVYIKNIGSITVSIWDKKDASIRYVPWRSSNLNDSHTDGRKWLYAPAHIWDSFYCADKIAESHNKPASVDAFKFDGREYINDGGSGKGNYKDCLALTFIPRKQWHGKTFTYSELRNEWDAGTIERGDQRGMLIKVRGLECVINGSVMFYDENAIDTVFSRKGRVPKPKIESESIF